MSINPVSGINANDLPSSPSSPAERQRAPASVKQSDLESRPTREIKKPQPEPAAFELPQDEVQVQRDPAGSGQIVIKYLDDKGNLILQVPSSQVLGLARAIEQTFAAQAKDRAEHPLPTEEGAPHAD